MTDANDPQNQHPHDEHAHDHAHDHDHSHGHDHAHDPLHPQPGATVNIDELDPANRSLAEALRVSFGILKVVMIVLVIAFLLSGGFEVREGEVGVRLHFGAVVGDATARVYEPGWHFAWPEPIDRAIIVPTGVQQVRLDENTDFWFAVRQGQELTPIDQLPPQPSLQPGKDGSLITGDKNIVHAKWVINYHVHKADAATFAQNVGSMQKADQLVRQAASHGIVKTVATVEADQFVRSNINRDRIKRAISDTLMALDAGITIDDVLLEQPTAPLAVRPAFRAVSEAESQRAKQIEQARQQATEALNRVAGEGHVQLLAAIDEYEAARAAGEKQAVQQAERKLNEIMESPAVTGDVSRLLAEARAYRTEAKKAIEAEAYAFQRLLPQYQSNPGIVVNRLQQDAREQILSGEVETFYLPSDPTKTVYLEINRDPEIRQRREAEAYRRQQEQAAGQ